MESARIESQLPFQKSRSASQTKRIAQSGMRRRPVFDKTYDLLNLRASSLDGLDRAIATGRETVANSFRA